MSDVDIPLEELMRTTATGRAYGITPTGFVPPSIGRLLDEKLAAARLLFGDDLDLTSGSANRKWCELMALEEARIWEHLGCYFADSFVPTATGDALSMLGDELGIPRPHHRATGFVTVKLQADLPAGHTEVELVRGTRILTSGGHDYFLDATIKLDAGAKKQNVAVTAFAPGPEQNLDPATPTQVLDRFNELDQRSAIVRTVATAAGGDVVVIEHTTPTTGGESYWADEDYRDLLLAYPRNLWTPDAVRVAVALVPGVRQVIVKDLYGGLDINQSIFGNFSFVERLFSEERSLGEPYYFTVLVAPGEGAIWEGAGQLRERVRAAVDAVRPVGILPKIDQATLVGVGFSCTLAVEGLPIPGGTASAVNSSPEAVALKTRILDRVRRYVSGLNIGEPVRYSEVLWAIMEEPGVVDAKQLRLRRYPGQLTVTGTPGTPQSFAAEQDVVIAPTEVAELVDALEGISIV